eukprot:CAMPEP_0177671458 /NCGR_PEP_ID=MMETSP0447-20121125/24718_1 /TAXON_ID=0 /ORGANISM="Stygamoeba regulata, Strain BSH-02190019" /LENGTH=32 /DNA_ID= /DNA_START= /DNA_END= /DNA_ORIENTATION=
MSSAMLSPPMPSPGWPSSSTRPFRTYMALLCA